MPGGPAPICSAPQRVSDAVVSLCFCDMQAERDERVKCIFAQLRKAHRNRGVI